MARITIDVDDLRAKAETDPAWAIRGRAIQAYASLEQALFALFVQLTNMQPDIAGVIFFKITSSQARNAIIDKLQRKIHGGKYALFWNSYILQLRQIDTKRNELVHWNAVNNVHIDSELNYVHSVYLAPPNSWGLNKDSPVITAEDMIEFIEKCRIYSRLCSEFVNLIYDKIPPDILLAWRDTFQQPVVYPLPDNHPLSQKPPIPESPPQSSEA